MKKQILFLLFINLFLGLNAQSNNDILINQTFISMIGSVCEETPDDNPCAGLEIFLILNFSKNNVSILEKEVSSCGVENINYTLDYKWELIQNHEIKIYNNPKEIAYDFLKNLVIKVENKKVIGYTKRGDKKTDKFEFKKIDIK
ncbi:hypothetical protein ATE84_3475 [Aquimarina sp. MAR_2010_214]|uniref:hypothetical protein n=1 Tax=Aquimarina sp. MAR_2010_214 TaxID=1250026 RepID=UPI000C7137FE|nr:hypothetical protein [Aquimarina sp. MAR_2010_214]PKV51390.1 hypothetical protein ATE84_3475 [Aquimarina sp. MAR_2010_214]